MSSLRNAVKRKTHKERPQPRDRSKFGLLERKKDYKARADDFHRKEKALQSLRRKAEERNPDEFYFAMESARTRDGVHIKSATQPNKYTQEQLRLFKGQDIGYVAAKTQAEAKKVERLRASLHFIGAPDQAPQEEGSSSGGRSAARHTVFVDGEEEARAFRPEEFFDTPGELLGRTFNRPRTAQLAAPDAVRGLAPGAGGARRAEQRQAAAYKELLQREARREKLGGVLERMTLEKAVMGKGRKRKLATASGPGQLPVYRWKQERKR